jgi:hypothetical protein
MQQGCKNLLAVKKSSTHSSHPFRQSNCSGIIRWSTLHNLSLVSDGSSYLSLSFIFQVPRLATLPSLREGHSCSDVSRTPDPFGFRVLVPLPSMTLLPLGIPPNCSPIGKIQTYLYPFLSLHVPFSFFQAGVQSTPHVLTSYHEWFRASKWLSINIRVSYMDLGCRSMIASFPSTSSL